MKTQVSEKLIGDILALESYMKNILGYTDEEIDDIKHGINPFKKSKIAEAKFKKLTTELNELMEAERNAVLEEILKED